MFFYGTSPSMHTLKNRVKNGIKLVMTCDYILNNIEVYSKTSSLPNKPFDPSQHNQTIL